MSCFVIADNIISSLGFSSRENFEQLVSNQSGIKLIQDSDLSPVPFWASMVDNELLNIEFAKYFSKHDYSKFEKMVLLSIKLALNKTDINISSKKTLIILSTTKGNINLLENENDTDFELERVTLWHTAGLIKNVFNTAHVPVIISQACISGVLALIHAFQFIEAGCYENIIVCGADINSHFVISGFQSFKALGASPCKPFDESRDGLSLGEGAATIILSANAPAKNDEPLIKIIAGSSSNDANHISGPSRNGEGLYIAVNKTLNEAGITGVDYICAHGTATPYNDEMEAKAFKWANLENSPLNSLKGYFGHTLGAAGVLESVISIHSMKNNLLIKNLGYETHGVTEMIHIIRENTDIEINTCLKTASGFGGCNAAILFSKE